MTIGGTRDRLAILGGIPAFPSPLHVGCPNMGDHGRFLARLEAALHRRRLTNGGPLVQEFEERICALLGVANCVATCNATLALQIAARALGFSGEVLLPSFTFPATAHSVSWQGGTPVFCDIAPGTHNLDPSAVARSITTETTGILATHLWGKPCDIDALGRIAEEHRLPLLFDASHALGCKAGRRMIGNFGNAEVLSFHATKIVNCFEGGAVVTNDSDLAARLRRLRDHGFCETGEVLDIGTNAKMSEASAAMGLTNLEAFPTFVAANLANYEAYHDGLRETTGCTLVAHDTRAGGNYHYVVMEVDSARAGIERDALLRVLHAENVLARRYFYPGCHRMRPYATKRTWWLPETERTAERVLALPTGTAVKPEDVGRICAVIARALRQSAEIRAHLYRSEAKP